MQTKKLPNLEFLPQVCELIQQGHKVSIKAKGNSMRPFLESSRDVIILSKVDTPTVGDVVLAEIAKGIYVLHRIEKIDNETAILRGDGNTTQTEKCRIENIKAIACEFIRKGKKYSTNDKSWTIYSWTWTRLLPFRRILLALYRLLWLGILPNKIKKLFNK